MNRVAHRTFASLVVAGALITVSTVLIWALSRGDRIALVDGVRVFAGLALLLLIIWGLIWIVRSLVRLPRR